MNRLVAFLLFAVALSASAQITPADRRQLGAILPHLLETLYVHPEKGKELAAQLRAAFESGRLDAAGTPAEFAEAVNRELAAANDRHLRMRFAPDRASEPVLTVAAWNARRAAMAGGSPRQPERAADREAMRQVNYGVLGARVLEGNVGYLEMRGFMPAEETLAALAGAMKLLAHTDAVIVDVRNCPGGSADTVSYLASYFFGPERRVLMNRYNRPMNRSMESTTVDVDGRRRPDVDLYVLTAAHSASACESFAFTLQQWGRAKTVGEKTAGAGNNNMFVPVGLGLDFSVSIGTAIHPKTGKAFEAVGVVPDIAVPADRALEAAHAEALRALRKVSAPAAAPTANPRLEDYIGTYGVRQITLRDGALYYQRTGARGGVLQPLAPDQFDLNGDVMVTFQRDADGAVTSMTIQWKDGRREVVGREGR